MDVNVARAILEAPRARTAHGGGVLMSCCLKGCLSGSELMYFDVRLLMTSFGILAGHDSADAVEQVLGLDRLAVWVERTVRGLS